MSVKKFVDKNSSSILCKFGLIVRVNEKTFIHFCMGEGWWENNKMKFISNYIYFQDYLK